MMGTSHTTADRMEASSVAVDVCMVNLVAAVRNPKTPRETIGKKPRRSLRFFLTWHEDSNLHGGCARQPVKKLEAVNVDRRRPRKSKSAVLRRCRLGLFQARGFRRRRRSRIAIDMAARKSTRSIYLLFASSARLSFIER
jgi:hypothetical protein